MFILGLCGEEKKLFLTQAYVIGKIYLYNYVVKTATTKNGEFKEEKSK